MINMCVCVCYLGNFPSVHHSCLNVIAMNWFRPEQICHYIGHTVSTRHLPICWTLSNVESLEIFKRLQLTMWVIWTLDGTTLWLMAVLRDTMVTLILTVTGRHLLWLVLHRCDHLSDSRTQSHLDIPTCTVRLTVSGHHLITPSPTSYLQSVEAG